MRSWYYSIIGGLVVGTVVLILIMAMVFQQIRKIATQPVVPEPPVISWIQQDADTVFGCPGDVVRDNVTVSSSEAAMIAVFSTYLRGGPTGDNVEPQRLGDASIVIIPSARTLEDRDITWTIPDYPPGEYVRALAAGTLFRNTEPVFRERPFVIVEGCEATDDSR